MGRSGLTLEPLSEKEGGEGHQAMRTARRRASAVNGNSSGVSRLMSAYGPNAVKPPMAPIITSSTPGAAGDGLGRSSGLAGSPKTAAPPPWALRPRTAGQPSVLQP